MATVDDETMELVRELVLPGFRSKLDVREALDDLIDLGDLDQEAHEVAAQVWKERLAEEQSWPHPTGFERVQAAFAALDALGIVTAMNLGFDAGECNQLVGTLRTPIEVDEGTYPFREWASVAFHAQDAERLASEPATLYLLFGAWFPGAPIADRVDKAKLRRDHPERQAEWTRMDTALGDLVAEVLRRQGLEVVWSGSPADRIQVVNLLWRKPLPVR